MLVFYCYKLLFKGKNMNTLIIVKMTNTTYDNWKKKFDEDADAQSKMMRNTIVGKVDNSTAMISIEVFNPEMLGEFMTSDELEIWKKRWVYLTRSFN